MKWLHAVWVPLSLFILACGRLAEDGPSTIGPGSVEEAEELCAQEDASGCLYLAKLFADPPARKAHPEAFVTFNRVSCERGLGSACYDLGFIRLTGEGGRLDKREAGRLLNLGCDAGDGRACFTAGVQARRGDGVVKSSSKALGLFQKACDLEKTFEACAEVGQMWTTNEIAGAPDLEKSKTWYAKACANQPDHPFCKR